MVERWLPVVGYEGLYEVSDRGHVRSLARPVRRGSGMWTQPGRIMRPAVRKCGHLHLVLCKDGRQVTRLVHHLVLAAFVGPCPDGLEGCHDNGNPSDNTPGNLRWDTRSSNVLDSVKHGTHNHASLTECRNGHQLSPDNVYPAHPSRPNARACITCARDRAREQHRRNIEKRNAA